MRCHTILAVFLAPSLGASQPIPDLRQDELQLLQQTLSMTTPQLIQQDPYQDANPADSAALAQNIRDLAAQLSDARGTLALAASAQQAQGTLALAASVQQAQEAQQASQSMMAFYADQAQKAAQAAFAQPYAQPFPQQAPQAPYAGAQTYAQAFAQQAPQPFAQPFAQPVAQPFAQQQAQQFFAQPYAQQAFSSPYAQLAARAKATMQAPTSAPMQVSVEGEELRREQQLVIELTNESSVAKHEAAASAERAALLESQASKAAAQLLREHQLREVADARAAAAEKDREAVEFHSVELKTGLASAQADAANATARAAAAEAQLHQSDADLGESTAGVADEKRAASAFVMGAKERVAKIEAEEVELVDEARQAVKTAKADAEMKVEKAKEESEEEIRQVRLEADAREARSAEAERAAREAVAAAQAEAQKEIVLAQREVTAQVQASRDSVEKAQRLMQAWVPQSQ